MTAIQFVLIAIAAFIVLAGLFMVIRSFKRRNGAEAAAVSVKTVFPSYRVAGNIVDQPDFGIRLLARRALALTALI